MNLLKSLPLGVPLILTAHSAMAAGILLGSGTLNNPNDLTRVQVGQNVFEFLDLSVTAGLSVTAATGIYGSQGFHWTNRSEISDLFNAFGMTYVSAPQTVVSFISTTAQRASFLSYLGSTHIPPDDGTLGWVDDWTTSTFHTYICVYTSVATCGVNNTSGFWPSNASIGVYLTRVVPVPEPSTYGMMILGIGGLALWRRRRTVRPPAK